MMYDVHKDMRYGVRGAGKKSITGDVMAESRGLGTTLHVMARLLFFQDVNSSFIFAN
jgi:hypothetical protein